MAPVAKSSASGAPQSLSGLGHGLGGRGNLVAEERATDRRTVATEARFFACLCAVRGSARLRREQLNLPVSHRHFTDRRIRSVVLVPLDDRIPSCGLERGDAPGRTVILQIDESVPWCWFLLMIGSLLAPLKEGTHLDLRLQHYLLVYRSLCFVRILNLMLLHLSIIADSTQQGAAARGSVRVPHHRTRIRAASTKCTRDDVRTRGSCQSCLVCAHPIQSTPPAPPLAAIPDPPLPSPPVKPLATPHPPIRHEMDRDHPPGDGRGTRSTSDDHRRGREFPPASQGKARPAQSSGSSSHSEHRRQPPPHSDHPAGAAGRTTPVTSDGQASGGHGHGSTSRGHDPTGFSRWTNFWGVFDKLRVYVLVGRVRDKLCTPGSMDKTPPDELPLSSFCHGTVPGPPMTRTEEILLKQHLEQGLRQVQSAVKAMGLQPVELHDVEIFQSSQSRLGGVARVRPLFLSMSSLHQAFESRYLPISSSRNFEAELEKAELQKKELVSAYETFSSQFMVKVVSAYDNNDITPEFAKELEYLAECYKQNVMKAMNAGGNLLTLKCLIGKISMSDNVGSLVDNIKFYRSVGLFVVTVIDSTIQCVGTSPIQFKSIGKEASRLLNHDFTFDQLKLDCDRYDEVSFGAGYQIWGRQTIGKLLLKFKDKNNSFSINLNSISDNVAADGGGNAPAVLNNDSATTRVSLDKLFGADTRLVLKMPFPSLNANFEVRHKIPHAVYSGGLEVVTVPGRRIPVLDFSAVGGFKYVGFGARLQLREGIRSTTLGMSLTAEKLAVGLTYKSPSNYKATIWKKIADSSTSLAAQASYKPQPVGNEASSADGVDSGFRFALGLKHVVDPTLYCKARIGTDGTSVMMKKSSSDGRLSIKGAVHVDFDHPRDPPKMGFVCSFR